MKTTIDIIATAEAAEGIDFTGTDVIVVDVLRATTSIHCALRAGAKTVYPVESVEQARKMKVDIPDALLCGERGGVAPSGFDMGNSPADFASAPLDDMEIILTTTNGTLAVSNTRGARRVIAATMLNAASAAGHLVRRPNGDPSNGDPAAVYIICAGTDGRFSIEDFYCAGLIVSAFAVKGYGVPTDQAWAAAILADLPIAAVVNGTTCRHMAVLQKKGFFRDLELALHVETSPFGMRVPVLDRRTGGFILTDLAET